MAARVWGASAGALQRLLGPLAYREAPDGGWGWVVAGAFFVVEVFTYGVIKSFGIFLRDLMEEFDESNTRVSWILSICVFVMTFTAPLSAVLTNRLGFQPVVMAGGLLISVGTITSSFMNSVNAMYITMGVIAGLGYCLTFLPTVTLLSQYFSRRRSLVTAVASTGESLAMFALAPAFSALRDSVGWRCSMAVLGALQGSVVVCGALLRPIVIIAPDDGPAPAKEEAERLAPGEEGRGLAREGAGTESEPTREDSLSSGDSGVQSMKEPGEGAWPGEEGGAGPRKEGAGQREERAGPGEERAPLRGEKEASGNKPRGEEEEEEGGEKKGERDEERGERERKEGEGEATARRRPPPPPKLLDFSVLREGGFVCYSLFGLFATLGFFAPPLYVVPLSAGRGVGHERAALTLSVMAAAEVPGRLCAGWALSRRRLARRKPQALLGCIVALTATLVAFAALASGFWGLALCCALYGFFMGAVSCTHIPMLAEEEVAGVERMASAAGVYVFIQSFAGLAGPPLGGVLVDWTQDYGSAFYSCAVGMGLGALFLALVRPANRGLLCPRRGQPPAPAPAPPRPLCPAEDQGTDCCPDYPDTDRDQSQKGQPITSSA